MSTTITVPEGFQYVGGAVLSTVFVLIGQTIVVGRWRKKAQVKYPQLYADTAVAETNKDAYIFNCAQRAHQNTLEAIPMVLITTVISGLKYPTYAAAACATWSLSRIFYTRGYISGDPKKRQNVASAIATVGLLGMLGTATYITGKAISC